LSPGASRPLRKNAAARPERLTATPLLRFFDTIIP